MDLQIRPADWAGFTEILGEKGCAGCWCMLWRLPRKQFDAQKGAANRAAMQALFAAGQGPGLIAYGDGRPIGWIQVDRRAAFVRLETSRVLKPVDATPVWSVACFVVDRTVRRQGVAVALLQAAADLVRDRGGTVLEGYPIDPADRRYPSAFAWTGFAEVFRRAGFEEVARRSPTRPGMRKLLSG